MNEDRDKWVVGDIASDDQGYYGTISAVDGVYFIRDGDEEGEWLDPSELYIPAP